MANASLWYSAWLRGIHAPALDRPKYPPSAEFGDPKMNEDTLNLSIRKFLKVVGINSQREIEQAVAKAIAANTATGTESFPAKMTLEIPGLKVKVEFSGDIDLQ
jgi:Family of unknown function (DUF6494)